MAYLTLLTVPIGNLNDISSRGLEKIQKGKIFLAEDTRVFKSLLKLLGIEYGDKVIHAFHDHTGEKSSDFYLKYLEDDQEIILVSDAGSPVVSDPAYGLVKRVVEKGYKVHTIPGVSSPIVALELSGLPPDPFHFYGFPPREKEKQSKFFHKLGRIKGTHILFESPRRILGTIKNLAIALPDVEVCVARELTKTFETVHRFLAKDFNEENEGIITKGEFVLLFHVPKENEGLGGNTAKVQKMVYEYLEGKRTTKHLAKIFSEVLNEETKEVYNRLK